MAGGIHPYMRRRKYTPRVPNNHPTFMYLLRENNPAHRNLLILWELVKLH